MFSFLNMLLDKITKQMRNLRWKFSATTRKIHAKQHPGPWWPIFHMHADDIDDVISRLSRFSNDNVFLSI